MGNKFTGPSIKFKLLLFSFCISLIPIAIITTIYFFNARNTLKKQTLAWMTAVVESRKAHLVASLEAKKGRTIDFSSDGFIRDSLEAIVHKEVFSEGVVVSLNNHLLRNKKPLDPHIVAITVANKDGMVVASTSETLIGKDISDRAVFLQAISENQERAYIGQPVHIPYLQADCIPIATLLTTRVGGDAMGVISNVYGIAVLSEITTNRAGMGGTGEVYLVNRDRLMLTESRFIKGALLKQVVDTEPVRKISREGKEMTGIYPNYRGVPIVGASAYIPEYGWTLLAEIDEAEAFAPIRMLGIVAMVIGGISAAVVAGGGIIFALSAARPIKKLIVATDKFKAGDLKYRAEIGRSDEIGLLAYSFNDMADGLEKTITEQTRIARNLETSLKEKEVLLKEIHHRVKNNMQVIISMHMLQSRYIRTDNIGDMLKDIQRRIKAMALVHEKLYQSGDLANVNFYDYTKHLTNDIFRSFGSSISNIELKIDVENIYLDIDTSVLCGLVINELITNSLKYAFPTSSAGAASRPNGSRGKITVTMRRNEDSKSEIELIISDNGIGMPEDLDFRNTKTLGLHLVNTLVKQLDDGEVNLNRGKGTEFQIKFKEIKSKEMV